MKNDAFSLSLPAEDTLGQRAHPDLIEHSSRLQKKFYQCGEDAWCFVGNGLSNQTFVRGPQGIIAIDTGECVEEMQAAVDMLRGVTDEPIVACIYSHFHYVNGTRAIIADGADVPIYGHSGIPANLARFGGEVGPRSTRGLVHQFAIVMPDDGEDGQVNVGLGRFFRNPDHSPFTPGYLAPTETFDQPVTKTIAGLIVEMTPAPSDATDSITIWFPELKVCVNNLVWPALFNIFAIRGEEYRDPRILLTGIEHLASLPTEHLLCAHGPPLSGAEEITQVIADYGDSIRYIWDQTVRGVNQGLTLDQLTGFVQLPDRFNRSYFTRQFYGVVEHHVRQIYAGLFGWFDEDVSKLFPGEPVARSTRLIAGFGGIDKVRQAFDEAMVDEDFRWALEVSSWLLAGDNPAEEDCLRQAGALRAVASRTTSANVRNWCITRALELSGQVDLNRFRQHRFGYREVLAGQPATFVAVLRVLLDPERARGIDIEVCWHFDDGSRAGLRLRGQVAIPTDGSSADINVTLSHKTWADLLSGKTSHADALSSGDVQLSGATVDFMKFIAAFDVWHDQS